MARSGLLPLLSSVFEQRRADWRRGDDRSIVDQARALMTARGDTAILRLAQSILATYPTLDADGRRDFFRYMADELDVDGGAIAHLATTYADTGDWKALSALQTAAEPKRQTLFRRLNYAEGATAELVTMRHHLLGEIDENPEFAKIDLDFVHLFHSWFNRGFLVLQRIDWSTPAEILEKIMAYEAVHEINDWDDLRRRTLPADRLCYAYFHPRMPHDPLIFVEIALTEDIPSSIQDVLSDAREPSQPEKLDTAVFYSISNCQPGLLGISFGEALIKGVVAALTDEHPNLSTFVTLSPIPTLRRWIEASFGSEQVKSYARDDEKIAELAAHYLASEKRDDGRPKDPVARFHLSNGAELFNVLGGADASPAGKRQSFGAMVNYRYEKSKLEDNSDAFAADGTIAVSRRVSGMSRQGNATLSKEGKSGE